MGLPERHQAHGNRNQIGGRCMQPGFQSHAVFNEMTGSSARDCDRIGNFAALQTPQIFQSGAWPGLGGHF